MKLIMELFFGWSEDPKTAFKLSKDYAQRALALDSKNIDALCTMALLSLIMLDHDKAVQYANQALKVEPNDPMAMGIHGTVDIFCGRFERGAQLNKKAFNMTQDIFLPYYPTMEGAAYYLMKNYELALTTVNMALKLNEN